MCASPSPSKDPSQFGAWFVRCHYEKKYRLSIAAGAGIKFVVVYLGGGYQQQNLGGK
jgi:hypothetical protein